MSSDGIAGSGNGTAPAAASGAEAFMASTANQGRRGAGAARHEKTYPIYARARHSVGILGLFARWGKWVPVIESEID